MAPAGSGAMTPGNALVGASVAFHGNGASLPRDATGSADCRLPCSSASLTADTGPQPRRSCGTPSDPGLSVPWRAGGRRARPEDRGRGQGPAVAGNQRFAAGKSIALSMGPGARRSLYCAARTHAIVLCCATRACRHVFNAGLGDLFVVRVAGDCVDHEAIASISTAEQLGTALRGARPRGLRRHRGGDRAVRTGRGRPTGRGQPSSNGAARRAAARG